LLACYRADAVSVSVQLSRLPFAVSPPGDGAALNEDARRKCVGSRQS